MAPHSTLLEDVYSSVSGRTKRRISKVKLEEAGWNATHDNVFSKVKDILADAVTLAHPDLYYFGFSRVYTRNTKHTTTRDLVGEQVLEKLV